MHKISAIIITKNEELFIEECLRSLLPVADEIIVVDSFSVDCTEEICKKYKVRFVQHAFTGYMDQKNYAVSLARNKYILSLDADETLSKELRDSILEEKKDFKYDGYLFNRLSNFCGQWIRHSTWYPDRQLRLFNPEKGSWGYINVHESVKMVRGSKVRKMKGNLLHWPCTSPRELSEKVELYSEIAAREFYKAGKKTYFFTARVHGIWRFFLTYVIHLGFLDGRNGYIVCSIGAHSSYLKYYKLRILNKTRKT